MARSPRGSPPRAPRRWSCDVSVEVAAFARRWGSRSCRWRCRATATTPPTSSATRLADAILAPWPAGLAGHGRATCSRGRTGSPRRVALSRLRRPRRDRASPTGRADESSCLQGSGGTSVGRPMSTAAAAAHARTGTGSASGPARGPRIPGRELCARRRGRHPCRAGRPRRRRRREPPRGGHSRGPPARRTTRHRPRARRRRPGRHLGALAGRRTSGRTCSRGHSPSAAPVGALEHGRRRRARRAGHRSRGRRSGLPAVRAMRVAVITPVAGRHEHLRLQRRGLLRSTLPVDPHVVVCMGDTGAADVAADQAEPPATRGPRRGARLRGCRWPGRATPARSGRSSPAPTCWSSSTSTASPRPAWCSATSEPRAEDAAPRLLCGPVTYLPPPRRPATTSTGSASWPTRIRPAPRPPEDETLPGRRPALFWSLSFAVTPATSGRRIGGFCEDYRGYGGEDTDFGQRAAAAGVRLDWVGGADAYHQYHPSSDPPVEHLDDILANAARLPPALGLVADGRLAGRVPAPGPRPRGSGRRLARGPGVRPAPGQP